MTTFLSTRGARFIVTGDVTEGDSRVACHYVPTIADLEEFVAYVKELRVLVGPQIVEGANEDLRHRGA